MADNSILIVDDNEANLKVARFALMGEGFDVRVARDGEEALEILASFHPRLILMDIQLPGLNGLEVTRRLKANLATRDIVVVAVTAYAMKGDRENALAAGCDGYITKPLDPIRLPVQVAEYMGSAPPAVSPAESATDEAGAAPVEVELKPGTIDRAPILLVEDNPTTRKMFRIALESAGHTVIEAHDAATALAVMRKVIPSLIVQDLILPDMDGLVLAREFRQHLGGQPVPIICMSGFLSRLDEARAMESGFEQVLVKPVDPLYLLEVIKTHLALPPEKSVNLGQGRLILVVDDDPLQRRLATAWLESASFEVLTANDGASGLSAARRARPAAIVSDLLMPEMDGYSFCLAVRRDSELSGIPVILNTSSYAQPEDRDLAMRVGASGFVSKLDGLDAVVVAVCAALRKPVAPLPADALEGVDEEHAWRAFAQLERQVQENAYLLRRTAFLESQLAVLAGVAESLAKRRGIYGVLGEVLGACLDMAGISKGALYTSELDGRLVLRHFIGFSDPEVSRLRGCLGQEALLTDLTRRARVAVIPSDAVPAAAAQELIVGAGVTSILLVPVVWGNTTYGAMLLGARAANIKGEDSLAFARVLGAQMGQAMGLTEAFNRLTASELRYRTLTENAHDAICVLTPDGIIHEVNRAFTEMAGRPSEEVVGKSIQEFAEPAGATEPDAKKESHELTPHYEFRKPNGDLTLTEFSTAEVNIGGDQLVFAIGRDVTERVHTQAQLLVSDRMASVGTLAAGVAHEINNPLAVVLGNLELAAEDLRVLASEPGSSPRLSSLQGTFRDAQEAGERVRQIVKDLKIFSYHETDRRTAVNVEDVLDSSLRMAWNELRHRARVERHFAGVARVDANESRLGQVFLNLIVNAAQILPDGHADTNQVTITTGMNTAGQVVIEVKDNGPGISPEVLRNLFVPFFTTKPAGSGTGLGLAICKRIVEGLNGRIAVETEVGKGSIFTVTLQAAVEVKESEPVPIPAPVPARRRGNVLVVDDEPMIGLAISRALTAEHDVLTFTNAGAALEVLAAGKRFDVIFCDLMMPVITGAEFHRRLAELIPEQAERIVFLTGGAFTESARTFLEKVPNERIEKPFRLLPLRALVNERVV